MPQEKTDEERLSFCNGLFVGQLDDAELDAFERMVAAGKARRRYDKSNVAAFLGMAQVELIR